jgi:hypothetical protein
MSVTEIDPISVGPVWSERLGGWEGRERVGRGSGEGRGAAIPSKSNLTSFCILFSSALRILSSSRDRVASASSLFRLPKHMLSSSDGVYIQSGRMGFLLIVVP